MARGGTFAGLFGRSPFKPMQEHMRTVKKCAAQVTKLFEALCDGDQKKVEAVKERIFELENEADKIKNELRSRLPKSLFMPVDRRDLLEVLDLQDNIADTAQDIAGLVVARKMDVAEGMRQPLLNLVRRCVDACDQASRIIERLDELVETGFRGPESDSVIEMVEQLNNIESDTDQMGLELVQSLFAHEDDMNPVSVVFWHDLINMIGELADYSEKVGNRLRLLLAR
ncbi:MAG: TIGR00153 family protein [Alphaproteobacteria bacterium]|nr:TIGR00153 family protein [Alphaproteobacteria bacterium]